MTYIKGTLDIAAYLESVLVRYVNVTDYNIDIGTPEQIDSLVSAPGSEDELEQTVEI